MERRSKTRRQYEALAIMLLLDHLKASYWRAEALGILKLANFPNLQPILGRNSPHRVASDAPSISIGNLDSIIMDGRTTPQQEQKRTEFFPGADVHILRSAWSATDCQRAIDAAGRHHKWSTGRHHLFPTTDVPAADLPDGLGEECLGLARNVILPAISAAFGTGSVRRLNFKDMFLARYEPSGQPGLGRHTDGSAYSFNMLLSEPALDFSGGGTWIEPVGLVRPERGDVLIHRGSVLHEGCPVCHGTRHVLVGFVQEDDSDDDADKELGARSKFLLRTIRAFPLGIVVEVDEGDSVSCAIAVDVSDDGAARKAGIEKGDCLRGIIGRGDGFISFDGLSFESVMELLVGMKEVGSVQMVVERWCSK
eukprot:CAMPEP_0194293588 /NCGR_PEP_ID=MMETSP0169-20130528/48248_1 /TAXON_ID=218684 /ORGANISM="Corethron pennatum, Strain L29A3" /LENGTH=365 /DNA_ID=CAMNT_0039042149 /DNA_START=15 /DNA_END=1112 /DNA_ORIENTATION=+